MPRGVEIDAATREQLRDAANVLGLDEAAIAHKARVSRRVVREVLAGRRTRVSERTHARLTRVMLGTGARAVPSLPAGTPARRSPRLPILVAAAAIAAGVLVWRVANPPPDPALVFKCGERSLGIRDARSGRELWRVSTAARCELAFIAPWKEASMVIYGTLNDGPDGGQLHARDLLSGEPLWSLAIPSADAGRHFPAEIATTGRFYPARTCTIMDCSRVCVDDFDGDGTDDIVVKWTFEPWYPNCIVWYSVDPARPRHLVEKGRYYSCGSVWSVTTHDVDGDGRPGVAVAGTNNASGYQGAMVTFLDADHWTGGAVDSIAATHWRSPPGLVDGSLARIVFPQFDPDFMAALGQNRLEVAEVLLTPDTIEVSIGSQRTPCAIVRLDACLEVLDVRPAPTVGLAFAGAPEALSRFTDGYLDRWIGRRARFGSCLR